MRVVGLRHPSNIVPACARDPSSHRSCTDSAGVSSRGSRYCLRRFSLLPCSPGSGKIPGTHPSALLLFSYSQMTDGCFFFLSFRTSVHRLMESYPFILLMDGNRRGRNSHLPLLLRRGSTCFAAFLHICECFWLYI